MFRACVLRGASRWCVMHGGKSDQWVQAHSCCLWIAVSWLQDVHRCWCVSGTPHQKTVAVLSKVVFGVFQASDERTFLKGKYSCLLQNSGVPVQVGGSLPIETIETSKAVTGKE